MADGDVCSVSTTPEDEGIAAAMLEVGRIGKELENDVINALDIVSFDVSTVGLINGVVVNNSSMEVFRIPVVV